MKRHASTRPTQQPRRLVTPRAERGVTLLETLIALLIFTVALLGLAALQATAVRAQSGVSARMTIASSIADISERLRSNFDAINGVQVGNAISTGYQYAQSFNDQAAPPAVSRNCLSLTCTREERATFDLESWRILVRNSMPQGSVLVSGSARNGLDVTIMWFDNSFTERNAAADDVDLDASLTSPVCPSPAGAAALMRFCCPAAAAAPAGVRCYNAKVIP